MRHLLTIAAAALALSLGPFALGDLVAITGEGALVDYFGSDPFVPNETAPELQITGEGSVENTGGVAVFDDSAFTLDILFLNSYDNESKISFDDLMVTAAFQPGGASFQAIRFYDPNDADDFVELPFSLFIDSMDFGLPRPAEDTIRGMGTGEADFLSLNGALMGAVDLGVGLERDCDATLPSTASVGIQVVEPAPGSKIRFDVFGLNHHSPWIVEGNNPNSGSGGMTTTCTPPPPSDVIPEPASICLLGAAVAVLHVSRRRRKCGLIA